MSEEIYDMQIAPLLMEAGKIAEEFGMNLMAVVEYAPGEIGRTEFFKPDAHLHFKMAAWAARAKGNVDALIFQLVEYALKHGHNSICIDKLTREIK